MPDELRSIEGSALPGPPMPGDIDCIVTGFPWCVFHFFFAKKKAFIDDIRALQPTAFTDEHVQKGKRSEKQPHS